MPKNKNDIQDSRKSLIKKYCPNPRDPTDGLRQKKNGVYERAEMINGQRYSWSSRDPVEVWRKRAEALADAEDAALEIQLLEDEGPLFSDVAEIYRAQVLEMKHGTQRSYLPALDRAVNAFGSRRVKSIEPWEIKSFLSGMNAARTTVSNQKTVLNSIFQTYIDSPLWHGDYNPAKLTQLPRGLQHDRRMPPTSAQIDIVKQSVHDPDALPAIIFLCTGERRGEACALQLKDIDFEKNIIHITKACEWIANQPHITVTKTAAGVRKLPLLDLLKSALQPFLDFPPETYIIGMGKNPVTASVYNRLWTAFWQKHDYAHESEKLSCRKKNGKKYICHQKVYAADICAHQFRHEYVCMLCESGVPEEIAIQLVGHANAKMIHEVYLHLKPSMLTAAAAALNRKLEDS